MAGQKRDAEDKPVVERARQVEWKNKIFNLCARGATMVDRNK